MYDKDILTCILPQYSQGSSPYETGMINNVGAVAECLAKKAEQLSYKHDYLSPFAKGAREANIPYIGGKEDDITVIVAQVVTK